MACRPGYKRTTSSVERAAGSRSKIDWMSSLIRLTTPIARTSFGGAASGLGMRGVTVLGGFGGPRTRAVLFSSGQFGSRLHIILVQLVFDRVNQRLPARLDNVARQSDGAPSALAVGGFDQHADPCFGAGAIVEH